MLGWSWRGRIFNVIAKNVIMSVFSTFSLISDATKLSVCRGVYGGTATQPSFLSRHIETYIHQSLVGWGCVNCSSRWNVNQSNPALRSWGSEMHDRPIAPFCLCATCGGRSWIEESGPKVWRWLHPPFTVRSIIVLKRWPRVAVDFVNKNILVLC